ncbi:MAG: O-acetyl-ADP-ribose deacetylase [Bryobacterales bacterium]
MEFDVAGHRLVFQKGDITTIAADAIVNAANSGLLGGGGVDGAIHRSGGPGIMRELNEVRAQIGRCPPGQAVVTSAGDLPADWVIHAVGPIYRDGKSGEAEQLAACYRNSLRLAQEHDALRVTMPSISTGVYGYPMRSAAQIAIETVVGCLEQPDNTLKSVTFVLYDDPAFRTHVELAEKLLA